MTLSLEKIEQIRKLAKQGHSKTYAARMIGCNRKTVHKYWPKKEEEKEPNLSKRIFQMLGEGQPPVKIVEELGYPGYVEEQVKAFKKLKQRELNELLAKVDEANKTLGALQAQIKEAQEDKEKEHAMVQKLDAKKDELGKEISNKENRLSSLRTQIEDREKEYKRLEFGLAVKKDLMFLDKFLEAPTSIPTRAVATIVGVVMDAFSKWASLEENKKIFSGREFPIFMDHDIEGVRKVLQILCKKFYHIAPQNLREFLVEEILRGEIPDSIKQLAVKEGYEEAVKTLTHHPCSICGKDMIMTKEQLREAVKKEKWAHPFCIEQSKKRGQGSP